MRMIFVLSSGRAGSTWIARVVKRLYRRAYVRHEPYGNVGLRELQAQYFYGGVHDVCAVKWLWSLRDKLLHKAQIDTRATHYFESTAPLSTLAPIMHRTFPGCVVIGLVRDGRDTVRSLMNEGWYVNNDYAEARRLHPLPQPADWHQRSLVTKCTWYWRAMVESFLDHVDLLVKLEDLVGPAGYEHWCQLARVCGFPPVSSRSYVHWKGRKVNAARAAIYGFFDSWDEKAKDEFWAMGRGLMERLGYALVPGICQDAWAPPTN